MSGFDTLLSLDTSEDDSPSASMFSNRQSLQLFQANDRRFLEVERAELGSIKIFRVSSSGHKVSLSEADHLTYLLPMKGSLVSSTRTAEVQASAGRNGLLFSANERVTQAKPNANGKYEALVILIPEQSIKHQIVTDARLEIELPFHRRTPSEQSFVHYLEYLEPELRRKDSPLGQSKLRDTAGAFALDLASELISTLSTENPDIGNLNVSALLKAKEIMLSQFDEPLSVTGIAAELGVSVRSLQLAFRHHYNKSPREFLTDVRLQAARSLLCDPDNNDKIASVALECGFFHQGRFARAYRERFGELPSSTGRRACN